VDNHSVKREKSRGAVTAICRRHWRLVHARRIMQQRAALVLLLIIDDDVDDPADTYDDDND
jgi:hypothetical protein